MQTTFFYFAFERNGCQYNKFFLIYIVRRAILFTLDKVCSEIWFAKYFYISINWFFFIDKCLFNSTFNKDIPSIFFYLSIDKNQREYVYIHILSAKKRQCVTRYIIMVNIFTIKHSNITEYRDAEKWGFGSEFRLTRSGSDGKADPGSIRKAGSRYDQKSP